MAHSYTGSYEEYRGNVQTEIFYRVSPSYPQSSSAISLILSGNVVQSTSSGNPNYTVDTESMYRSEYALVGVGFNSEGTPYKDTLRTCTEVRIPIQTGSEVEDVEWVNFPVKYRTLHSSWIYLWTTEEQKTIVSGNWLRGSEGTGSFRFEDTEEPFDSGSEHMPDSLDYSCQLVVSPSHSVVFVVYKPQNFEFAGDYNATLNNAISDAHNSLFYFSGSSKLKKYALDYHKSPSIGGHYAGALNINQATDDEAIRTKDFFKEFKNRGFTSGSGSTIAVQTLDLSFMSYRAISASVYVDRVQTKVDTSAASISQTNIRQVWEDMQGGNVDDSQTIYFVERSELETTGSSSGKEEPYRIKVLRKSTIPVSGSILFNMDHHTPVRITAATVYAPFLNRVYRTDEYGVVKELYPEDQNV